MKLSIHNVAMLLILTLSSIGQAGEAAWTAIPRSRWKGAVDVEVPALKRTAAAAIALLTVSFHSIRAASSDPIRALRYE